MTAPLAPVLLALLVAPPAPGEVLDGADAGLAPASSRPVALMPRAITSFGAATSDGWLYVLGGYHGTPHDYSLEGQADEFYRMNLLAPADLELLPSPGRAQSVALVAHEGRLWRVGGMRIDNTADEPTDMRSLDRVEVFDPATGTWTAGPSMTVPRSSHMAAVADGRLFAVGGWTLGGDAETGTFLEHLEVLEPSDDAARWRREPMPFARRAFGLAATGEHLVLVGGMTPDGPTNAVEVLDVDGGTWTSGPDFPGGGFAAAAVAVGEHVLASGKEGSVWTWRVGEDAWRIVGRHAFPRFFHQLVATADGHVLALGGIGGMDGSGRIRHVEALDTSALLAAPAPAAADEAAADRRETVGSAVGGASDPHLTVWTIPNATAAKNRQGIALVGRELFLFGGNRSVGQHDFEAHHFLDEAAVLNLVNFGWSELPAFPVARQTMSTALSADHGRVFVVGGFGHDGEVARTHAGTFVLDLDARSWDEGPAMPVTRSQFGLGMHEGVLWALGGLDYDPRRPSDERFDHLTSIVRWDTRDPEAGWEVADVTLPDTRRAFASATLGDRFVMVGGMREDFALVEDAIAFDMATRMFEPFPMSSVPRLSAEMVALDGKLYLAGGSSPDETGDLSSNRSIEVYDPDVGAWRPFLDTLPFETRHMRMLPFGHQLLIYTAHDADRDAVTLALVDPTAR